MEFKIISIGTLSRHDLWGETNPVRTAHATTVLVRSKDRIQGIDPRLINAGISLGATCHKRRNGVTSKQEAGVRPG